MLDIHDLDFAFFRYFKLTNPDKLPYLRPIVPLKHFYETIIASKNRHSSRH